jgi:hypothetical protein
MIAAVRWYAVGFGIGANGGRETQRKGRPRRKAMVPHWKKGIRDGAFALQSFVTAHEVELRQPRSALWKLLAAESGLLPGHK